MQNFIGPLSDEAKQHAETHAANGTDPLTPEAIGAASEFYAENLAQSAEIAAQAHTNQAIASHLSTVNPHQISPSLIGAAPISHNHAASAINSGQLAIANGGTGASTAAQALTNLGAAPASHNHPNLNNFTSFLTSNQSGLRGNFVFTAFNFFLNQNTWTTIYPGLFLSRAKVILIGCMINNWEGGGGIMHGWKEADLISTSQATIQYQSVNLSLRMMNGNLQGNANSLFVSGLLEFTGLMMYYGY
jgi:hypothetical protein